MPMFTANLSGPLPVTASFPLKSTGPATVTVAGSVWSGQADTMIGIQVSMDGSVLGDAKIFSNAPSTHRAVVATHYDVTLDRAWPEPGVPPTYQITLNPLNGDTVSDTNDTYSIALTV